MAAVAAALFWSVPFFGLIDLATIVRPGEFLPSVPLEASWGAFFTAIVAGAFVGVAAQPLDRLAPAVQLLIAAAALIGGAVQGGRSEPLIVAAAVALLAALLLIGAPRLRVPTLTPAVPLLVAACAGAPFWIAYAWQAAAASRTGMDDDISVGVPHWAVQSAAGYAVAGCVFAAAVWPPGRRLLATSGGVAASLIGVATAVYPEAIGAMPSRALGVAALVWGVVVVVLAWLPRAGRNTP